MVISAYRHCRPAVITIPTNGLLSDRIIERVDRICRECPESEIGINLSLDGIGEEHDAIRGVPGNWAKSMATWSRLKELQKARHNLVLSIHTVVSRFNQERFHEIYDGPAGPGARQLHHRGGRGTGGAGHDRLGHHA